MKKVSKTSVKKRCDDLWRDIVHLKNYCEVCGKPIEDPPEKVKGLNSHHVVGRGNYNLRWDLRNGCLLCINHHRFGKRNAHDHGRWFTKWFNEHRPEDAEYLDDPKWEITKTWYLSDYQEILANLKTLYKEVCGA